MEIESSQNISYLAPFKTKTIQKKMSTKTKYGKTALIAGGSEGLGAAFANYLAADGMDLVLVARRLETLEEIAKNIRTKYSVTVTCINCDLSVPDAAAKIKEQVGDLEINLLVYNVGLSYIGHYEENSIEHHTQIGQTNVMSCLNMLHLFGTPMVQKGKGAVVLMSSLAGMQGSGFLSVYAATKAFNRVLGESLWYEWKERGVDVIACCAGATATPNFLNTKPEKTSLFSPKVQSPEEVVVECFKKLGKMPSFVAGTSNKIASFIMQRLLPRKWAVKIISSTTREMYRL